MTALDGATCALLPPGAYADPGWYGREQRDVFERTWNLVAYAGDLAGGAPVVAAIGGERVVVTRDDDGVVSAFRHGGRPRPAEVDHRSAEDRVCAVGEWGGLVFAHLDPEAATPFDAWLGAFPSAGWVGVFPWDDLVEIGRVSFPLACNWKLYVENHIDVYHLWFLHRESLGMFDHAGLTWSTSGDRKSVV